jgi:hypothetical protein
VNSSPGATGKEFRIAFCEKYRCEPDRFESAVLRRCFPWWVRWPGSMLLSLSPRLFRRELSLISRLGHAQNPSQIRQELEGYAYENARDRSFRTETLGLRLSRRRFVHLMRRVLPDIAPAEQSAPPAPARSTDQ